ncbi:enhanced serine sensitivity protein SseB [Streptomyces clavuligerus]|uniref:Enhanced serine sensitivity protein SseB n=1 Tax=Streptomyces clavuligerus TaxID=1901 RepID=B5GVF8_STRCL|nr:enhanced serine sensitivity protein SseB C-terminal domain-containing protein [Streptomyces clavuligerus]ANW17958.1 hypothetical protein BB341_06875 [Streptomyces clavuligerus]AXU12519.1 enhanced serine sensitivity protein SseB [Streptomyces clavuligerus]EDY50304.1 conserved hypothetical protein [Streptomyces clavuligerus]EFG09474.1 Hypothetical protein SCLAV_4403 [Streptomyces clavuligerus]MBY6302414.1 enhanced serine sensitivity protein SseB [Streptomyces clavuligerus]
MTIPEQVRPHSAGWPANELEEALAASLGDPSAGARLLEVLGRSPVWVPLPEGGSTESRHLDLPTLELDGAPYVPVFSSEGQFLDCVGTHMSYTVAPARDFARGLPPQLGIAVNPGGAVGAPLPPPAVAELCRAGTLSPDAPGAGGRVRMYEPDWQEEPVDFLAAAAQEFRETGVVLSARRVLASVEGDPPALFIGVQLLTPPVPEPWEGQGPAGAEPWESPERTAPLDALGRALGRVQVPWPVHLVLLDLAGQDPVAQAMLERVRPFHQHGD